MSLILDFKAALESLVQPQERCVERWMPALSAWPPNSSLALKQPFLLAAGSPLFAAGVCLCRSRMLLFLGFKAALKSLVQPQERCVERWMPALSALSPNSSLRPQSGPTCWWQIAVFLQVGFAFAGAGCCCF